MSVAGTEALREIFLAPSAGFEPALMAPEANALSPELRGRGSECIAFRRPLHIGAYLKSIISRFESGGSQRYSQVCLVAVVATRCPS